MFIFLRQLVDVISSSAPVCVATSSRSILLLIRVTTYSLLLYWHHLCKHSSHSCFISFHFSDVLIFYQAINFFMWIRLRQFVDWNFIVCYVFPLHIIINFCVSCCITIICVRIIFHFCFLFSDSSDALNFLSFIEF